MKRDTSPDPALLKMVGWVLILITLPYAWFAFSRAYAKVDSYSWPTVSAEMLSSSMYKRTGKRMDWCVKVSYRYRVDNRVYTGNRPGVSMVGNAGCDIDQSVIQRWLVTMAPGRRVLAYYDPDDPAHAALRLVGLDLGDYAFCTTACLFLLIGGLTVRQAKKAKPI